MILNFFRSFPLLRGKRSHIFTVINYGGESGATLRYFSKSLKKKGLDLDAGFEVCMPINHIGRSDPEPEDVQKEKYERWNLMASQITSTIKHKKDVGYEKASLFNRIFRTGIMHRIASRFFHKYDDNFLTDDKCEGCGKCKEICPVGNIEIKNGKPEWNNECQLCLACLNWCPNEAIEYGDESIGRKRYKNPDISHSEMLG